MQGEHQETEVWKNILRVLPEAEMKDDNEGFLVVETNLLIGGKNGETLTGNYQPVWTAEEIERVLLREDGCVASEDVPLLMSALEASHDT